jgi:hypothetical protein
MLDAMTTNDAIAGIGAVVLPALLGALIWWRFRFASDLRGRRIRTYSAAWWLIVLFCPWGMIWALFRPDESAAERARNLREITGANGR